MKLDLLPKSHFEIVTDLLCDGAPVSLRTPQEVREDLNSPTFFTDIVRKVSDRWGPYPSYRQFAGMLYEGVDISNESEASLAYEANVTYHLYNMLQSGRRVYYVVPGLAAKLARTEINVDTHFLRSPFREIFVQLDPGLFTMNDVDGTATPVHGFYLYLEDCGDTKHVRIMVVSLMPPNEKYPFNDAVYYYRLDLGPGKLRQVVKEAIARNIETAPPDLKKYGGYTNLEYMEEFTYFAINTLLYLTSKDPDIIERFPVDFESRAGRVKSSTKRQKLLKRAKKCCSMPIFIAGLNIRSSPSDIEDIRRAGSIGKWKLTQRVLVSGHYRAQWYGGKDSDDRRQELIWIEPYEKGPDIGTYISGRTVQVGR